MLLYFFLALVALWVFLYSAKRTKDSPPLISGWIPWLGCSIPFYTNPTEFILDCKKKYGNIFTLYIGGRYFTYIMDPNHLKLFFMIKNPEKSVSFDDSVVEFTSRVFGVPRKEFMDHHKELIGLVRNSMSQNLLEVAINRYSLHLKNEFSNWKDQGEGELFNDIYNVVYWSNFKILLGEIFLNEKFKGSKPYFAKMDNNFEIAAAGIIPEWIFSIQDARDYFYEMFDFGIKNLEIEERSILSSVIHRIGTDEKSTRNFCIAILWASEANSLPGTYWAVVNVLKNPSIL